MDWSTLGRTIEIGRDDMRSTLDRVVSNSGHVVTGFDTEELEAALGSDWTSGPVNHSLGETFGGTK